MPGDLNVLEPGKSFWKGAAIAEGMPGPPAEEVVNAIRDIVLRILASDPKLASHPGQDPGTLGRCVGRWICCLPGEKQLPSHRP